MGLFNRKDKTEEERLQRLMMIQDRLSEAYRWMDSSFPFLEPLWKFLMHGESTAHNVRAEIQERLDRTLTRENAEMREIIQGMQRHLHAFGVDGSDTKREKASQDGILEAIRKLHEVKDERQADSDNS